MRIDLYSMTTKVVVDNRIPLRYYYRIADNLLKQANIYRQEKNIVDLYIILVRYSSLVSETIPFHRDYQSILPRERAAHRKRLPAVLDELESLKPEFDYRVDQLNRSRGGPHVYELDEPNRPSFAAETPSLEWPAVDKRSYGSVDVKQPSSMAIQPSNRNNNGRNQGLSLNPLPMAKQFQGLSIGMPLPNKETLSRHSFLGPNGLRGQWLGPTAEIKVQYPSSVDLIPAKDSSQSKQFGISSVKDSDPMGSISAMESVLSLDDGRWPQLAAESCPAVVNEARADPFQFVSIRQPSPPPVLAKVQQEFAPISPSKVADPRPGPANPCQDGMPDSNTYKHLHVPVNMMEDFLRLARANTEKNLETCGILAGSLKNRVFHITTLIIPKQESTSDSCQALNEEEIFEVQDKLSLFSLGWIHTHPSQTCFMSSVDLHTQYPYQIMLPEAVAIVMAPTDSSSPCGIFHLSDPGGVSVIRNCQQRGFHPHEEPEDGSPIYEHCSHVFMNPKSRFDVVDLR